MQTLNNNDLAFLAILGNGDMTARALRMYADRTYLFTELATPHLCVMWDAYVDLLQQARSTPGMKRTREVAAAFMADAVQRSEALTEPLRDKCDRILDRYIRGEFPGEEESRLLVSNLIGQEANRAVMAKVSTCAGLSELKRTIDRSVRQVDELSKSGQRKEDGLGVLFSPLRDIRKLATHTVRVPTGINWLDKASGGGGRGGELWLIMGAPGGGKSVMAVQFACAQALLGNHTMWATYEQTLEGDLAERMIANITDTPLESIRDVGFDQLPEDVRNRYWTAVSGSEDFLHALDMTEHESDPSDPADYGGVASIRRQFESLKAEGIVCRTLILDWFGAMMNRVAQTLNKDLSREYRFVAMDEIMELKRFAKEEDIMVIVFHQLDRDAVNARPTYLANASQAQDMKSLQNYFDYVFPIGIRDENNVCYFSNAKSRKFGRVVLTLRLIGDRSRFIMETGWLPNKNGQFYRPMEGDGDMDAAELSAMYSREL